MATRSILITGCSSGIGYDAAHTLQRRGWRVFASCRSADDCTRLEAEGLTSPLLDYRKSDSIAAAMDQVMTETGGTLDAVFNNGAYALAGSLEDTPVDAMREIFETNFFGWHDLSRRAIAVMRQQGHGRIVQCSSVLGLAGLRMRGPYVATKFALEGYTDVLRLELRGTGILPILIEPGPIDTRIRINAQAHYETWVERVNTPWAGFYKETLEPRLYADNPPPDRFELPAAAVTNTLMRALEAPRPHARYYVTTPTYIVGFLKRVLPTRWLDRVLVKG